MKKVVFSLLAGLAIVLSFTSIQSTNQASLNDPLPKGSITLDSLNDPLPK
jgi:hypothetical protein